MLPSLFSRTLGVALAVFALASSAAPGKGQPNATVSSGLLVTVDTAIDGANPPGTDSFGKPFDAENRPGIRVGDTVYRAPWMRSTGSKGTYSGFVDKTSLSYNALWQFVALDHRTLALLWSRTYGSCLSDSGDSFVCREGADGEPAAANVGSDLASLVDSAGNSAIVIASSHPARGKFLDGRYWDYDIDVAREIVLAIGAPDASDNEFNEELDLGGAGEVSVIGVAGLTHGQADFSIVSGGRGRLQGYLGYDPATDRYDGFLPSARPRIDTRSAQQCNASSCTVSQTIGTLTVNGTVSNGAAGYLVVAYDAHTLAQREAQTFVTKGCGSTDDCSTVATSMAQHLEDYAAHHPHLLIVITSLETPGQQPNPVTADPNIPQNDWIRLGKAVAKVGGTRDRFNAAASTPNRNYSLIGWPGAGEGGGREATQTAAGDARLRGALVPDSRSLFRPANVSGTSAPGERLQQLVVQAPSPGGGWPELKGGTDYQPGRHPAIQYIGSQVPQLGSDPRSAYWKQRVGTPNGPVVGTLKDSVDKVQMPQPPAAPQGLQPLTFTSVDLAWAKVQLKNELDWVENVRNYVNTLAAPTEVATEHAWPDAKTLADNLTEQLNVIDEQSELAFDAFGVVESLLSFASGGAGFFEDKLVKFIEILAGMTETAKVLFDAKYSTPPDDLKIQADELAQTLLTEAEQSRQAFLRVGDAIVADYPKLMEVGTWAGCNPDGGCASGFEEYAITPEFVRIGATLASRALDRTIYEHLVPLAFPVFDTGLASVPDNSLWFQCSGIAFFGAPADGWGRDQSPHFGASTQSLDELDPGLNPYDQANRNAPHNRWRTYVMLHRHFATSGWPSQDVLDRMFAPVSTSEWNYGNAPDTGGLGMSPQDFMRNAWSQGGATRFIPSQDCTWFRPGGAQEPEPPPR